MRTQGPRELLGAWVEIIDAGVVVMFELGERLPIEQPDGWFSYGLRISDARGTYVKYFTARISHDEPTLYTFEFATATRTYYDPHQIEYRDSVLLARFPHTTLSLTPNGFITGFALIDGTTVAENIRTYLLP